MSLEIILHLATKIKQLVRDFMAKQFNLKSPASFNLNDENRHTAGIRWPAWCKELDTYLLGSGVTDKPQKKAVLLYVSSPAVNEIYSTMEPDDAIRCEFGAVNDSEFKRQIIYVCSSSNCDSTSSRHPRLR